MAFERNGQNSSRCRQISNGIKAFESVVIERERERIYRDALSLQRCNHLIIQPRYSRGCMMERFSVMMTAFRDFLPII
ncbi:hypothetical protein OUZ56_007724 [Daphnia magna]|uniref:Uncharacterized protein n=1 Tax=Daphnia magna TaxID=35525 RepID=A0ABR0AAS9_9CRUS|nr:hypothetical protein OUZ56_007724 [Daphnia magna]